MTHWYNILAALPKHSMTEKLPNKKNFNIVFFQLLGSLVFLLPTGLPVPVRYLVYRCKVLLVLFIMSFISLQFVYTFKCTNVFGLIIYLMLEWYVQKKNYDTFFLLFFFLLCNFKSIIIKWIFHISILCRIVICIVQYLI